MTDRLMTAAEWESFVRDVWIAETLEKLAAEEAEDFAEEALWAETASPTERQPSPREEQ